MAEVKAPADVALAVAEEEAALGGMEVAGFQAAWYNSLVDPEYALPTRDPNSFAIIFSTTPVGFWEAMVAHLKSNTSTEDIETLSDPVDSFSRKVVDGAARRVEKELNCPVRVFHDTVHPVTRRPEVLLQTAGHVAGVARLYRPDDLEGSARAALVEELGVPRLFPVSIHPRYGGFFAYRGIILCEGVPASHLKQPPVPNPLPTAEGVATALRKFTQGWLDRDVGMEVKERYPPAAVSYYDYTLTREEKLSALKEAVFGDGED